MRVYRLDAIPPGLHYDEAANAILASDIATGKTHPLFIEAYTGKEVLFFYLAGASMRFLAALLATSYWHVTLSRYGFRASVFPRVVAQWQ